MPDLSHVFGSDLSVGLDGDLALVDGAALGRQYVLRRLLTNPGDYIWHLDYGAGLPAFVGEPEAAVEVAAIVRAQLALEDCVSQSPPPTVTATGSPDGSMVLSISYSDADTGTLQVLGLSVDALSAREI